MISGWRWGGVWLPGAWARASAWLAACAAVLAVGLGVWRGTLVDPVTLSGAAIALAVSWICLLPFFAVLVALSAVWGRGHRVRSALARIAAPGSVALFGYVALQLLTEGGGGSGLAGAALATAGGILLAELCRRFLLGVLLSGLANDLRRRSAPRLGPVLVSALALLGILLMAGDARRSARWGEELLASSRPAKRVLLVAVDGVTRDHFLYWSAMRDGSAAQELFEHGASGFVEWPPLPVREAAAALGTPPLGVLGGAARWPRVETILANALPGLTRRAAGPPDSTLWALAELTGRGALLVGWEREDLPDRGPARLVPPSAHDALMAHLAGERDALEPLGPDADRLRSFRELARPPLEDWRRGASLTRAEAAAAEGATALGLDPGDLWRDRFLLRAFVAELSSGEGLSLGMVRVAYARMLAGTLDPTDADVMRDAREAVVAYLDVVDHELSSLRRALRAGDLLALLLIPPFEYGARALAAPIVLFGEKAAREHAHSEPVPLAALTLTVRYLLGIKLPAEPEGEVAWPLLVPGLAERMPPERIASPRATAAGDAARGTSARSTSPGAVRPGAR